MHEQLHLIVAAGKRVFPFLFVVNKNAVISSLMNSHENRVISLKIIDIRCLRGI